MSSFHEELEHIRRNKKFYSLRDLYKKLEAINSKISLTKLSKIIRGIQNPSNQQEFLDLMQVFEITDASEIKKLEILANDFIPVEPLSEQELVKQLPIPFGKVFKDEEELDTWVEAFKEIIKKDSEPEI